MVPRFGTENLRRLWEVEQSPYSARLVGELGKKSSRRRKIPMTAVVALTVEGVQNPNDSKRFRAERRPEKMADCFWPPAVSKSALETPMKTSSFSFPGSGLLMSEKAAVSVDCVHMAART